MQSVRACFALHCVSAEAVVIPAEMFLVLFFFFSPGGSPLECCENYRTASLKVISGVINLLSF